MNNSERVPSPSLEQANGAIEGAQESALGLPERNRAQPSRFRLLEQRSLRFWVAAAAGTALIAFVVSIAISKIGRRPKASGPIRSLAVLPLQNLSGNASQEYFADGITDALITELAHIPELRVVSRTSVMQEKGIGSLCGR